MNVKSDKDLSVNYGGAVVIDDGVVRDDDRRDDHARGGVSLRTEREGATTKTGLRAATRARARSRWPRAAGQRRRGEARSRK